jgi:hypothetical protein
MPRFNHAFEIAFSLESDCKDVSDVTPAMLKQALLNRLRDLHGDEEWIEACGVPWHTCEIIPDEPEHEADCPAIDGFGCRCN